MIPTPAGHQCFGIRDHSIAAGRLLSNYVNELQSQGEMVDPSKLEFLRDLRF